MSDVTLIIMCAGNSSRFDQSIKKQWLRLEDEPLWLYVTNKISSIYDFNKIVITSNVHELNYMKNFSLEYVFVEGGNTRQESIKNALKVVETKYVMITDVARVNVPSSVILNLLDNKHLADCIVPVLDVSDTVIYNKNTIDRNSVKLIQTPQLSNTSVLNKALKTDEIFTDDSSAIKAINGSIFYIKGSPESNKITFSDDLNNFKDLKSPSNNTFTGIGLDIHEFEDDKTLVLGGVKFDTSYGFKAHSDGDVLIHSLIDAILGASGTGDIGEFFPDTNKKYKNANSALLLSFIVEFVKNVGFEIINVDITIVAQKPKITPMKKEMKIVLSKLLKIPMQFINIKATTSENMGFIGRNEGVLVQSIANLKFFDWKKI